MSELGAVADAVTGGVIGRAVEPRAGEGEGHTHEANCLNCGAPLIGRYCNQCGQHAHVHRTLGAFFHDFAHGVLHFEEKIWRTLPLLVWKPGELTRRYVEGQRASFVSPIALFLFCVFFMFAVIGMTGTMDSSMGAKSLGKAESDQTSELAGLQKQRAAAIAQGQPTTQLDAQIRDGQEQLQTLKSLQKNGVPTQIAAKKPMFHSDLPWLAKAVGKAKNNPELLFFKLKTNAYKFSWALIPISVPFVWLLFPFTRRFKLYDHTVFVTYSLCFMMLLLSGGTLVALVSDSIASILVRATDPHVSAAPGSLWRQPMGRCLADVSPDHLRLYRNRALCDLARRSRSARVIKRPPSRGRRSHRAWAAWLSGSMSRQPAATGLSSRRGRWSRRRSPS